MLRRDTGAPRIELGMPVHAVYEQLFREEFRWQSRRRPQVAIPFAEDPDLEPFVAAWFGCFASRGHLAGLEAEYIRAFDAERVPITPATLLDGIPLLARDSYLTPLELGTYGLSIGGSRPSFDLATVVLVDPRSSVDLMDLWNSRAAGDQVVPVPVPWIEALVPEIVQRLERRTRESGPWRGDITIIGTQRVPEEVVDGVARSFRAARLDTTIGNLPGVRFGLRPAWVGEQEGETQIELRNGRAELPLPSPACAAHYPSSAYRWAVVLDYMPWTLPDDGSVGGVLPRGATDVDQLLRVHSHGDLRVEEEGWILLAGAIDDRFEFVPASGSDVLGSVLGAPGREPSASEAGRVARQLIRQLGGLYTVALVQREPLVQLFDKAAQSAIPPEGDDAQRRRPPVRFLPRARVEEVINRIHRDSPRGRRNLMRALVERDVLRCGLQLDCSACGYANWTELGEIDISVRCARCLESFSFPQDDPPGRDRWAYRPTGAFSVEGFAYGGYAVAFALAFLAKGRGRSSWTTGLQLDTQTEIDFAVLRNEEEDWRPSRSVLLIGEAKSYNVFAPRDFERAAQLRKRFAESILVFATLRKELEESERAALRALARPRVMDAQELPYEPVVMVLTATELYSRDGAPECWRDAGGRAADLSAGLRRYGDVPAARIADITQQLYLDLEPQHEWWKSERSRLDRTRKRRGSRGSRDPRSN